MALISTDNLKAYALNPELLADKYPNAIDVITQLQSIVTALATLTNELKADHNATVTLVNELKGDVNGLLAKLDLDAGVTDTNYAATHGVASADAPSTSAADVTI
ncbi:MAG: hypothetical protein M3R02_11385 [Chloroflexota bacterium]|nr:hypothetical protein [Chloroflexota bacterium]